MLRRDLFLIPLKFCLSFKDLKTKRKLRSISLFSNDVRDAVNGQEKIPPITRIKDSFSNEVRILMRRY